MLHMCLVACASAPRAQLWVRAAHEEHWATILCSTADDAIRQSVRNRVDLALIDLQSAPPAQEPQLRKLVEQLSARHGPLLAVCGKPSWACGCTFRAWIVKATSRCCAEKQEAFCKNSAAMATEMGRIERQVRDMRRASGTCRCKTGHGIRQIVGAGIG
jgi:hypothetical protein